ncbi:Uncharacterised protein [Mycobacteroides abscessus subsp. abscessus]|nr:Uncharacterised protein [Mycobacteroides abscessus subsp. abscessus]
MPYGAETRHECLAPDAADGDGLVDSEEQNHGEHGETELQCNRTKPAAGRGLLDPWLPALLLFGRDVDEQSHRLCVPVRAARDHLFPQREKKARRSGVVGSRFYRDVDDYVRQAYVRARDLDSTTGIS